MRIGSININEDGISITWRLTAKDYVAKPKREDAEEVERLDKERLKAFLAPAVWGDGDVNVSKRYVRLIMGLSKFELWLGIIERLINELGFTIRLREYKVEVVAWSSNAIRLAKDWLSMQDVKELIELGASLGSEKLARIIKLASISIEERNRSMIEVPGTGIRMAMHINGCKVELWAWRSYEDDALRLIEELKRAGYEPSMRIAGKRRIVIIAHAKIRDDSRLKPVVCQKLNEWLSGTKDEKMRERITMVMKNLKCFNNA